MQKQPEHIIDFRELKGGAQGEKLETLVRELGKRLGLIVSWSGRGADLGRDLMFTETQKGILSDRKVKWLVQCKDKAQSGKAVYENDIGSITDRLKQHKAGGFLLVTTTTPGTALKSKLDALDIENGGEFHMLAWDATELSIQLVKDNNRDIFKLYFPNSYKKFLKLDSPDEALRILEGHLPSDKYKRIEEIIGQDIQEGTGLALSSLDSKSISKISEIMVNLRLDKDIDKAVKSTTDIEYDEFIKLLVILTDIDSGLAHKYIAALIRSNKDADLILNAFYFLTDNFELKPEEQLELATCLDKEALSILYEEEISSWLSIELVSNGSSYYELWSEIDQLSSSTRIDDIYIEDIIFKAVSKDKIQFEGDMLIEVELRYGGGQDGTSFDDSFPGTFKGYIDPTGTYIEGVTVNTERFYKD